MKTIIGKKDVLAIDDWFVTIPQGTVRMRDDRTKETWLVHIAPFELCKFPVTQDLYQAVTNGHPSTFKGGRLPVESVSWLEAVHFCNALSTYFGKASCYQIELAADTVTLDAMANGYRLPTEAEWQYACQAGARDIRYGALNEVAWFKDNSNKQSQEVGQKTPNPWGLYDMLGNVWEWCSDVYDETVYGSYRVFRGGGWCDEQRSVMATTRRRSHPFSFRIDDLGFRIATSVPKG